MPYEETENSTPFTFAGTSTDSATGYYYASDTSPSMTSSSDTVNQGCFPRIIFQLMEQGLMSADAQIKGLLTDIQYSENIYALKYILEYKGESVSVEVLIAIVKRLRSQAFDEAFSGETTIKLEWQLRIIVIILEQMFQNECQFTCQFLDRIRQVTSMYKNAYSKIVQHEGDVWKSNCAEFNKSGKSIGDFKCNYNSKYLLELIKNTLNSVSGDKISSKTKIDRAIAALKGLLVAVPGLAKVGIKSYTGVELPLGDFDIERSWKYFIEAFYVEPSGKPWYTTWRRLIILQNCLDKWCEQESAISASFKERVLLEYFWYHISLCYAEDAAENQDVSNELWFGILDTIQQLIHKPSSTTTQAICYYMALDSLNNATTEFIQFKSIEVLLSLEAKNSKVFVTAPDDIAHCDEKYIPKMVGMYDYLKRKLEVESKMISKYSPDEIMMKNSKQEKGKGKGVEKSPSDYIAEDLTCTIVCEAVDDFYQLNCQHIISSKAFLSLNNLECPYCRSEIRKDKVYYMPQQTIYNNVQHYTHINITGVDSQDAYKANYNAGENTDEKIFDEDNLKKQKRIRRKKYGSGFTLSSIWKSLTANRLLQKAKTAYKNKELDEALTIYAQILQADSTNYMALCNRAMVMIKMKPFKKALLDIETAIEVNKVYNDAWHLSLLTHISLGKKKDAEQDIGHIKHLDMQEKAFDVINEYVNKLGYFDVEWFRILVDSCSYKAMCNLNDIGKWNSLRNHYYGTDDYSGWYKTVASWYNTFNNMRINAFFEKVYYMHKRHMKAHFAYESHIKDLNTCRYLYDKGCLYLSGPNEVTIPIFKVPPNKYKLGILLWNYQKSMTITIVIKTSTEEIEYKTDVERHSYAEYILPCVVNVLYEEDIIIEFDINCLGVDLHWVCLYSEEKLDTMERNLKIETFPTGVKMINYRQFDCPDRTYAIYY